MKKAYLILLPLAMLGAAACQSLEPVQPGQSAQGQEIRFSSSIGDYTKATDKSFEAGDMAGLSISDPVSVSNVKLTYSDGTFTPERTLYWALDQAADKKCTFLAYSPFSASIDPGKAFAWTIPADQSAAGAYAAADLVTAKTQAGPADGTVHLSFNHALSRMVLTLENKVADDEIAGGARTGDPKLKRPVAGRDRAAPDFRRDFDGEGGVAGHTVFPNRICRSPIRLLSVGDDGKKAVLCDCRPCLSADCPVGGVARR